MKQIVQSSLERLKESLFSEEDRLLAALCRVTPPTPQEVPLEIPRTVPWDALADRAVREGLGPLLYRTLRTQRVGTIDNGLLSDLLQPAQQEALRKHVMGRAAEQVLWQRVLDGVLRTFASASIPVLLHKGVAYAENLYPEPYLRPMADIDPIVLPDHFAAASRCLEAFDFEVMIPLRPIGHPYECAFRHRTTGLEIDLHFRLSRRHQTRLTPEQLFNSSESCAAGWGRCLGPCEALLCHFLHLGTTHVFAKGLLPFLDARELVLRARPHWPKVLERAHQWGLRGVLGTGLYLLDSVFPGFLLPGERLQPRLCTAMVALMRTRSRPTEPIGNLDLLLRHPLKFALVDSWPDRFLLAGELLQSLWKQALTPSTKPRNGTPA